MKIFQTLFFILTCFVSNAQDTSLISRAVDYLKTEEFKEAITAWTNDLIDNNIREYRAIRKRAGKYRKEEEARMNFWLNRCAGIDSVYFTPQSGSRIDNPNDSLYFRSFDQHSYRGYISNCTDPVIFTPYLLSPAVIELRRFTGAKAGNILFGETHILRLQSEGGELKFLFHGVIYHN